MAKMFYTIEEAQTQLGLREEQIKQLVREGKLREFRDAGKVSFKAQDIEALTSERSAPGGADAMPLGDSGFGQKSGSSEIMLEPADGSSLGLSGSDMLTLEEAEAEPSSAGKKDDTVISSVGISVFDDEDLEVDADPMAKTILSTSGEMGVEGAGSGSGLLELTREKDDTSLGAELLEEIYPGEEEGEGPLMGDATRAGLEAAIDMPEVAEPEAIFEAPVVAAPTPAAAQQPTVVVTTVTYAGDAWSSAMTGALVAAAVVLMLCGLTVAGMVRGVVPSLVDVLVGNSLYFLLGAVGAAIIGTGVGWFLGKRA